MSGIRVTYSGLISLVVGITSIFTGLIFTLIVTRTVSITEYGIWGLISSLFGYVVTIEPMISYWATREIARNVDSGKTAILSSSLLSIMGIFIYSIIAYLVGHQTNIDQKILFFAIILIPLMFLNRTLNGINLGWKPHAVSYGVLASGIAQMPAALLFIYFLHLGVIGIILTTMMGNISSIIILTIFARQKIRNKIKKEFIGKWLKLFWLPLYPGVTSMIFFLDAVVFSLIAKSVEGLALWSVSLAISNLIPTSGLISRATYPKLLGENNTGYLKENISQLFYFAIPFVALAIVFAKPALFALNPIYEIAFPIVIFTSIFVFLNTISGVFQSLLSGMEKVDINENSTFRDYIKSKLFFLPTISLVQYSTYVIILAVGLLLLVQNVHSQLELVLYWSIAAIISHLPFTIYLYVLVKRNFALSLDIHRIGKFLLITFAVFGSTYFLIDKFLVYNSNIFEFIPHLLLLMLAAIGGYLLVTYFVDLKTRQLLNAIIQEVRNKTL